MAEVENVDVDGINSMYVNSLACVKIKIDESLG